MKKFYDMIYHNISWPHPLKAPQRDSAASILFSAPFHARIVKKRA